MNLIPRGLRAASQQSFRKDCAIPTTTMKSTSQIPLKQVPDFATRKPFARSWRKGARLSMNWLLGVLTLIKIIMLQIVIRLAKKVVTLNAESFTLKIRLAARLPLRLSKPQDVTLKSRCSRITMLLISLPLENSASSPTTES